MCWFGLSTSPFCLFFVCLRFVCRKVGGHQKQKMSLYVDRHRPTTLASLSHSPVLTTHLYTLANSHSLPHILIYGPPGAGKKTRVTALLKEIFGNTIEKTSVSLKTFATPAGRKIECPITGSSVHIEMNPR